MPEITDPAAEAREAAHRLLDSGGWFPDRKLIEELLAALERAERALEQKDEALGITAATLTEIGKEPELRFVRVRAESALEIIRTALASSSSRVEDTPQPKDEMPTVITTCPAGFHRTVCEVCGACQCWIHEGHSYAPVRPAELRERIAETVLVLRTEQKE